VNYEVDDCRRMEDAVKALQDSSDLCKKIALGQNVDNIPGKFTTLDIAPFMHCVCMCVHPSCRTVSM